MEVDQSNSTLVDLMRCLQYNVPHNRYDVDRQCQHFSRQLFDKFAAVRFWDVSFPADMTSPLTLLSDGAKPLFQLIMLAALIQEAVLLFSDNTVNAGFDHCAGFTVLLEILILTVSMRKRNNNSCVINHRKLVSKSSHLIKVGLCTN